MEGIMEIFILIFHKIILTFFSLAIIHFSTTKVNKEKTNIKYPNRWILVYLFITIYYTFLGRPLTIFFEKYDYNAWTNTLLGVLCLFPIVIFLRKDGENFNDLGLNIRKAPKSLAIGFLLGLGYLGYIYILQGEKYMLTSSIGFIFAKTAYKSIRAITNEIIFRGYIQKRLVIILGSLKGIVISAILYAAACSFIILAVNGRQISMIIFWFVFKFTAGLIYGYLAHRTDSLYGSALLSVMTNFG